MKKIRKHYLLSSNTIQKIERLSEKDSKTFSSVIENAVKLYHEERFKEKKELVDVLSSVEKELKGLRVIGNVIDRDTKMTLEFWNHYFYERDFSTFVTTDELKQEQLTIAEKLIQERIENNRQKKLDSQSKRKNNE